MVYDHWTLVVSCASCSLLCNLHIATSSNKYTQVLPFCVYITGPRYDLKLPGPKRAVLNSSACVSSPFSRLEPDQAPPSTKFCSLESTWLSSLARAKKRKGQILATDQSAEYPCFASWGGTYGDKIANSPIVLGLTAAASCYPLRAQMVTFLFRKCRQKTIILALTWPNSYRHAVPGNNP